MILSKTKQETDYPELVPEGGVIMSMQNVTSMWHPSLPRDTLWEYALALKALKEVFGNRTGLRVLDYGPSLGFPPLLLWLGHQVTLFEFWRRPPEEENALLEHMARVGARRTINAGTVTIWPRPQGKLTELEEERKFDAVFCLSMLQKMGRLWTAFVDMLGMVRVGGLLVVTTSEEDREPSIRDFMKEKYEAMLHLALISGYELLGGLAQWDWDNRENTFASMVLKKIK